jgi:photosystem II stability/assembly factor-like uncharacterized protein
MADGSRVYAVAGDRVVRFTVDRAGAHDSHSTLEGSDARCVAVDPRDRNRVYVGTFEDGLFSSDDGGETWRSDERGLTDRRVLSLAVSPSDSRAGVSIVYAGTEPSNLYRSEDGGRAWEPLPALLDVPSVPRWSFPPRPWTHHVRTIAPHPTDPARLTVGIELGGVIRSYDGGASWIDHNPRAHSDAHDLRTHPLAPDRLYEAAGQGIARSDDGGETWARREETLDRHYAWAQAIDPADPDLWYVSISRSPFAAHGEGDGDSLLLRSRGNGWESIDNWGRAPQLRRMPYALLALAQPAGRLLVGLRGGTLLTSDDAGESWAQLGLKLPDVTALAAVPE